nr:hypothetical protein [Tanacetum cinerariifolium]
HFEGNLFEPFFDEEIFSMKIDLHHFNVESDLIESLLNHDSSIISSSSKIDSLLDEFAGELTLLKLIPPGIDETDCDPEEEIRLIKKLLYNNSSPRPLEEFISKNSDVAIESFSPSPIPVEDSDSFMEEIDLSFTLNDSMPPGIEDDDYESERDILILEELLSNDSLSLSENKSFHFDTPSSPRPPTKPPNTPGTSYSAVSYFGGVTTVIMQPNVQEKDKGKAILIEEPKPLKRQAQIKLDKEVARQMEVELNVDINWNAMIEQVKKSERLIDAVMKYQALKRKPLTEGQARRNMIVYLKNMVNERVKVPGKEVSQEKEVEVESSKREGKSLEQEIAKKKKIKEETEELKKHLQIVPDDDDMYTDVVTDINK